MSVDESEQTIDLDERVQRAVTLIENLRLANEIPDEKLLDLQKLLQSDFFQSVLGIYQDIYRTVKTTGPPEIRARATAKATAAAFAISEEYAHPRLIELPRTTEGFGFNILGGREQSSPICISRIIPNGVAWKHGKLRKGDQLLSVNGVSVENEYHAIAVQLLKESQDQVRLVVRYAPHILEDIENRFEKHIQSRKSKQQSKSSIKK